MRTLEEVREHLTGAVGLWLPATRRGATAIGKAFEDHFGIVENNLQEADILGWELKAKRERSNSRLTLFTRAPSEPQAASQSLLDRFGYVGRGGLRRLYATIVSGRDVPVAGRAFSLAADTDGLHVTVDGDRVAGWRRSVIETVLSEKLAAMALITAESKRMDGVEHFRMRSCTLRWGTDYDRFLSLLDVGLSIDFRMKIREDGSIKDHGCAFRLPLQNIDMLYSNSTVVLSDG